MTLHPLTYHIHPSHNQSAMPALTATHFPTYHLPPFPTPLHPSTLQIFGQTCCTAPLSETNQCLQPLSLLSLPTPNAFPPPATHSLVSTAAPGHFKSRTHLPFHGCTCNSLAPGGLAPGGFAPACEAFSGRAGACSAPFRQCGSSSPSLQQTSAVVESSAFGSFCLICCSHDAGGGRPPRPVRWAHASAVQTAKVSPLHNNKL